MSPEWLVVAWSQIARRLSQPTAIALKLVSAAGSWTAARSGNGAVSFSPVKYRCVASCMAAACLVVASQGGSRLLLAQGSREHPLLRITCGDTTHNPHLVPFPDPVIPSVSVGPGRGEERPMHASPIPKPEKSLNRERLRYCFCRSTAASFPESRTVAAAAVAVTERGVAHGY